MNRKLLAAALSGTLALPIAAQLHADEMPVDPHFSVYGHVGRVLTIADTDSDDNDVNHCKFLPHLTVIPTTLDGDSYDT